MERKQYLFLGLAVVLIGLAVAGGMLWTKAGGLGPVFNQANNDVAKETKITMAVVSWQPETATLVYQDERKQTQTVTIKPLKPVVVVPIFKDGKLLKEELVLSTRSQYWQTVFCSGDKLQLTTNQDEVLKEIRNKGLRPCAK